MDFNCHGGHPEPRAEKGCNGSQRFLHKGGLSVWGQEEHLGNKVMRIPARPEGMDEGRDVA